MEIVGKWKLYDKSETLYLPDGKAFTWGQMSTQYPISLAEEMAVKVVGLTLLEVKTKYFARALYNIPPEMTDEEAFIEMERQDYLNATESTPEERIASALEYLVMVISEGKE